MNLLFYRNAVSVNPSELPRLDGGLHVCCWQPKWYAICPPEFNTYPFLVWWLFHQFRVFSNREYAIVMVKEGDKLLHRSCVFPRYFRFPFMEREDLQIGDTWTDEAHRGRGLATFALRYILARHCAAQRAFWYVTDERNLGSIRAVEKAGFVFVGRGYRTSRLRSWSLGKFVLERQEGTEFGPESARFVDSLSSRKP